MKRVIDQLAPGGSGPSLHPWLVVLALAPGIMLGGAIASLGVFALLKGTSLALFFALFVGFSATRCFSTKSRRRRGRCREPQA